MTYAPGRHPFAVRMRAQAARAHARLGQAAEFEGMLRDATRQSTEQALELYASAPAANRSPSREAIARIDLALALDGLGSPDEAGAQGSRALASPRVVDSVRSRAGDLVSSLTQRYRRLPSAAEEFVERYRELTSTL